MPSKRFCAAVVLLALPGAAHAQTVGEDLLRQYLLNIDVQPQWSASATTIRSEGERTVAEGLEFRNVDGERLVTLGRLTLDNLRPRPEGGFAADAARVDDAAIRSATGETTIPTAEASRLAIPDLRDLGFDPDQPLLFLSKLYSAMAEAEIGRLAAPVIEQRQAIEATGGVDSQASAHYSDLVLENWSGGVIQSFRFGPALIQNRSGDGPTRIELASAEARRLDVGTLGHVLDPAQYRNGRGDKVWRSAVDAILYTGIRITDEDASTVTIGGIGMTDLDLRQPEEPFALGIEQALARPDMTDEEEQALVREFVPSALRSYRIGELWLEGFALDDAPDDASGGLRRFTMTGVSAQGIDRIGFEGFIVEAPDARVLVGAFELAGLVFPDIDAVIRAAEIEEAGDGDGAQAQEELALLVPSLVPRVARILIENVSVTGDGVGPITLESYLGEADRFAGPIPTRASAALIGLTIPQAVLNADPETAGFFRGLEIDSITIDLEGDGRYDDADGRVHSSTAISARDLMSVRLEAELAGFTESWISRYSAAAAGDPEAAMPLLAELQLVSLVIEVDDQSMVERGFGFAAAQQGRDPAVFREELKGALPFMLSFLTDPILRTDVVQALQTFLEGGHTLTLRIEPPSPVSVADILVTSEAQPQSLPALLGTSVEARE
jgi:hypothetical protein